MKPDRTRRAGPALPALLLLLLSVPGPRAAAENRPVVAVPTIRGIEVPESAADACRTMVETALVKTRVFTVLSFTDVAEILAAQELALSDCSDESCAVEIGKLLAAEQIVQGELSRVGERLLLSLRLIDVSTGRSLQAEMQPVASLDGLQETAFATAFRLAGLSYRPESDGGVLERADIYVTAPRGRMLQVFLDGVPRGETPLLIEKVPFGTRVVEAKDGAYTFRREVSVQGKGIHEVHADLSELTGNLLLQPEPAEARGYTLWVDGRPVEPGLLKGLPAGQRSVRAAGGGWLYTGSAQVEPDRTTRLALRLEAAGSLRLRLPEGAVGRLERDGRGVPLGPGEEQPLPVGTYTLRVSHPDFQEHRQELAVRQGEALEVAPQLQPTEDFRRRQLLAGLELEREGLARRRKAATTAFFVSGGAALAGAGLTVLMEVLVADRVRTLEQTYDRYLATTVSGEAERLWADVQAYRGQVASLRTWRTVSLALAGAGGVAGGVCIALRPSTRGVDGRIRELQVEGGKR